MIKIVITVDVNIIEQIQNQQLKWYGHVQQMSKKQIPQIEMKQTP